MALTILGVIDELREEVLRRRRLKPLHGLAQKMGVNYHTLLQFLRDEHPVQEKTIRRIEQWVRQQQAEESRHERD